MSIDGIKVVIPVRKYLKEYISTYVTLQPYYRLSLEDGVGHIIIALLQKPTFCHEPKEPDYDDALVVVIPRGYAVFNRLEMTNKAVFAFNLMLDQMLKMQFRQYMHTSVLFGMDHKVAIANFCRIYNLSLDDTIEYETLKKDYYRHRKRTAEIRPKFLAEIKNISLSPQNI